MGCLRVYLALCVVAAHSNSVLPWAMHSGRQAVQIFFMISGFYMAMVLSQGYPSVKSFYASRWLRLAIPYYVVLLLVVTWGAITATISGTWAQLSPYGFPLHPLTSNGLAGIVFAALSNITILSQDWLCFLQHDYGTSFGFTSNFLHSQNPLYKYLLIPQSWSIGLELAFYVIVPYINKLRTRVILSIIMLSLIARMIAYHVLHLQHDPWNYRFFPFELALFLSGIIGWRIYTKYGFSKRLATCRKKSSYVIACAVLLLVMFVHVKFVRVISIILGIDIDSNHAELLGYFPFPVIIATLFAYFRHSRIDRFIGELSYPIYLLHFLAIIIISPLLKEVHIPEFLLGKLVGLTVILVSIVFFVFIIQPFEQWRHNLLVTMGQK